MADAAAENLAQHIASTFIGRKHAIVDEKSSGAGVIGDDAEARDRHQPSMSLLKHLFIDPFPGDSAARSISGVNRSVSKLLTLCNTAATRSRPMPVSIEGFGSGVRT